MGRIMTGLLAYLSFFGGCEYPSLLLLSHSGAGL